MKTLMRNGRDRRSENPSLGHAKKERVSLFGTDQRITSGPVARRPHSKAEYMTAPERFADSQIPLAPRAPSIHDPSATWAAQDFRTAKALFVPWLNRDIVHSIACTRPPAGGVAWQSISDAGISSRCSAAWRRYGRAARAQQPEVPVIGFLEPQNLTRYRLERSV